MPQMDMTSVLFSGAKASTLRWVEGLVMYMSSEKTADDPTAIVDGPVRLNVGVSNTAGCWRNKHIKG